MRVRPQPMSRSLIFRGRPAVLFFLTALLATVVASAAPPEKGKAKPADSPQPPLFHPIDVPTGPTAAALTVGVSFAPRSGPWSAVSALYAGTHPDAQVWDLRGPLSTKPGRIQIGAGTLFLNGFALAAGAPLVELATLQAGEHMKCWDLIDTDQVRPFPELFLEPGRIRDRRGIFNGDSEIDDYAKVLVLAHYTSAKAFAQAARHDLTYAHLFNEPERYRGQVVHLEGRLLKLHRFDPPDEARGEGVSDLYEGWIMTDEYGENPACIVFTDLPRGLKIGGDRRLNIPVGFDGYFYKRYRYKAYDTKKAHEFRDAPLVIGHSPTGRFGTNAENDGAGAGDATDDWGYKVMWVFLGVVGSALLGVIGLTYWFRRTDRLIRRRISASRHTGFVLPSSIVDREPWIGDREDGEPLVDRGS
jgi:hypothetical protein